MTNLDRLEELLAKAEAAQEWMREPDWADVFTRADLAKWINSRPTSIIPSLIAELRQLREIVRDAGPMLSEGARLMGTHSAWAEEARALHNKIKEVMG